MYIRVTRLTATADRNGTWEQEVGRQVERLIALLRRQPGFQRYMAARHSDGIHAVTISEWDTLEQAQQFALSRELARENERLGIRADSIDFYEASAVTPLAEAAR
jgi:heme-degrading monooxygenase HmoA